MLKRETHLFSDSHLFVAVRITLVLFTVWMFSTHFSRNNKKASLWIIYLVGSGFNARQTFYIERKEDIDIRNPELEAIV